MGSAVVKPLTRRRGKIKASGSVANSANGNKEENAGNCEPHVNPLSEQGSNPPTANSEQPSVEGDKASTSPKVRCASFIQDEISRLYDSDEEPYPIALARDERMNTSQMKQRSDILSHLSAPVEHLHVSNVSSTCTNRLPPSPDNHSIAKTHSNQETNTATCPAAEPPRKGTKASRRQPEEIRPRSAKNTGLRHGLTADVNIEDQDASRDARTPSPEYDELEDVRIMNPSPKSRDQSLLSPAEGRVTRVDSKCSSNAGDVGVSVSRTAHPAPEKKDEHSKEFRHVIFIQPSLSAHRNIDFVEQGGGENVPQKLYSPDRVPMATLTGNTFPEDRKCQKGGSQEFTRGDGNVKVQGNTSFSANASSNELKTEKKIHPFYKEEETLQSSDSVCDVTDDGMELLGSSRSSETSIPCIPSRQEQLMTNMVEVPTLNNPQVEEILATGEEFMGGLDEQFVKRYRKPSSQHEIHRERSSPKLNNLVGGGDFSSLQPSLGDVCEKHASNLSSVKGSETPLNGCPVPRLHGVKLPKISSSKNPLGNPLGAKLIPSPRPTSGTKQASVTHETNFDKDKRQNTSRPPSATSTRSKSSRPTYVADNTSIPGKPEASVTRAATGSVSNKSIDKPVSVKESFHSIGTSHSRSRPSSGQHSQSSSRSNTPRIGSDLPAPKETPSQVNSKASSTKQCFQASEPTQARSRPSSGKPSVTMSDSTQANSRPQSSNSRKSLNTVRCRTGVDNLSQLDMGQCAEDRGDGRTDTPVSKASRSSTRNEDRPAHKGGGEQSDRKDECVTNGEARKSLAPSTTTSSSRNSLNVAGEKQQSSHSREDLRLSCCLLKPDLTPSTAWCKYPKDTTEMSVTSPSTCRVHGSEGEDDTSQSGREKGNRNVTSCSPAHSEISVTYRDEVDFPTGLSQDQIGSIRKQLYEEGLKPAERDGGVAFFIPVTEDGLQPQSNNSTVTDRLTRSRKSSLNYEERMILANINRQVQLSKRTKFALRDIHNVRASTPGPEGNDKYRLEDEIDTDFDSSF